MLVEGRLRTNCFLPVHLYCSYMAWVDVFPIFNTGWLGNEREYNCG